MDGLMAMDMVDCVNIIAIADHGMANRTCDQTFILDDVSVLYLYIHDKNHNQSKTIIHIYVHRFLLLNCVLYFLSCVCSLSKDHCKYKYLNIYKQLFEEKKMNFTKRESLYSSDYRHLMMRRLGYSPLVLNFILISFSFHYSPSRLNTVAKAYYSTCGCLSCVLEL